MKPILPDIKNYYDVNKLIQPGPNAHIGLSVPQVIREYGSIKGKMKDLPYVLPYMIRCIRESKNSYKYINYQPNQSKQISDQALKEFEQLCSDMGITEIGYTKVDPDFIFKDKGILFENAIVLIMEMNKDKIDTAPSSIAVSEIFRTYMTLGVIVNKMTTFLKTQGLNAQAGPAIGGDVNYPMLAQKAGLGHTGKHGLLISPKSGPSLRIASIYTDIENLPFTSGDHEWIESFCKTCGKCVKACPADAIYDQPVILDDGSKECVDFKKCAVPFSNNHGCTLCVKKCTFFKGKYETIKKGAVESK
ncbi:[Fe-S]-binding protein [Acidaminobacter sp. JC074]|uniref:4Fe-4S binding protein n=1 Tax=Acidaminobacter sp. JC074 TaxID=2530199 RepID=UPI001F10CEA3|nr:4Fe-4S binding protein [Acidaminobacter sp. JC074]MCH4890979.1 [Fe-S]-binding protein [Acidaminobacter sp. JC074]